MSEINSDDLSAAPEGGKVIYVAEFDSGVIKVGHTATPRKRLKAHDRAARQMGSRITRYWLSGPHDHVKDNERFLIGHCSEHGKRATGELAGEFFIGLEFDSVRRYARTLPVAPRLTDGEVFRLPPCAGCDEEDQRPLTALAVYHQVDIGALRLVDTEGRDVTSMWATGVKHACQDAEIHWPWKLVFEFGTLDPKVIRP